MIGSFSIQGAGAGAPNWPSPHVWLGDIVMRRKYYDEAVSEYEAALNLAVPGPTTLDLAEIKKRFQRARKKSQEVGNKNDPEDEGT